MTNDIILPHPTLHHEILRSAREQIVNVCEFDIYWATVDRTDGCVTVIRRVSECIGDEILGLGEK